LILNLFEVFTEWVIRVWQVSGKDYTTINIDVKSIPTSHIYMTAQYPGFVHELRWYLHQGALVLSNLVSNFALQYEYFLLLHRSNYHSFSTRHCLLKFMYKAWILSGNVYVSCGYRFYIYIYFCVIFTRYLYSCEAIGNIHIEVQN
jgi:hypothetical protein